MNDLYVNIYIFYLFIKTSICNIYNIYPIQIYSFIPEDTFELIMDATGINSSMNNHKVIKKRL